MRCGSCGKRLTRECYDKNVCVFCGKSEKQIKKTKKEMWKQ